MEISRIKLFLFSKSADYKQLKRPNLLAYIHVTILGPVQYFVFEGTNSFVTRWEKAKCFPFQIVIFAPPDMQTFILFEVFAVVFLNCPAPEANNK